MNEYSMFSVWLARHTGAVGRRALVGKYFPAPGSHRLRVERRVAGHWRLVRFVSTTPRGRYRAALERPGVYRVRAGSVAGPNVRLR